MKTTTKCKDGTACLSVCLPAFLCHTPFPLLCSYRKLTSKCQKHGTPYLPSLTVVLKDLTAARLVAKKPKSERLIPFTKWQQVCWQAAHCCVDDHVALTL